MLLGIRKEIEMQMNDASTAAFSGFASNQGVSISVLGSTTNEVRGAK
jgi:hypothetical protein